MAEEQDPVLTDDKGRKDEVADALWQRRLTTGRARLQRSDLMVTMVIAVLLGVLVQMLFSYGLISASAVVVVLAIGAILSNVKVNRIFDPIDELGDQAESFAKGRRPVAFTTNFDQSETVRAADALNAIMRDMGRAERELMAEEERQAQFVSDVSHEIRTPLTAIQGTAETLMDPDMPQSMRERFLTNIIDECQRLTRLANDLLTLNRIEGSKGEIEMRRINLRTLIDATALGLEALFEERDVSLTISGEAPDILGNADRIRQIITNLAENASRFAPEGGHVSIELSGIGGKSVMAVSDDGPGFGDVDPARLFDRFYRADSSRTRGRGTGGTGLGLAIVKAIVEEHDGTVEAVNLPDHGACFIIAFPSLPPADSNEQV